MENLSCFSSEYEFGGVYFPPELSIEIKKNSLFIEYSHGRYGYWHYQFRMTENDMQLIGYEYNDLYGPLIERITSVNFLTRKKLVRQNIQDDEEKDPMFKDTWSNLPQEKPILLSEIKDFDRLEF